MHTADILADPRTAPPAAPRRAPGDCLRALRLGMPHLGPDGLDEGWLLTEAAHQHWIAVARACGARPAALRDRAGERVYPALVSWVYTGSPTPFAEDAVARLRHEVPPRAEGGWRSVLRVEGGGAGARIEMASVFARRDGPSNAALSAAEMDAAHAPPPMPELMPREARALRARAGAMREAAVTRPSSTPLLSVRVEAHEMDGAGLLPPAALLRHLSAAEAAALDGPWRAPPVHRREVHAYANVDPGDRIELECDLLATEVSPEPAVFSSIAARRASDGELVAACETVRC